MPEKPTALQILDTPMDPNEAEATSVRGYLVALLAALWAGGEGFSGKRPFGTSGWESELYGALVKAGYLESVDDRAGYQLIALAIEALAGPAERDREGDETA